MGRVGGGGEHVLDAAVTGPDLLRLGRGLTSEMIAACAQPDGDYLLLVCDDEDGPVCGYVCYGRTPMTAATWDLYWVATHRDARGRGVATRLVHAMEAEIRRAGARIVRIETSQLEAYGSARALYARLAYVEAGRIPDFYRPGDDLIILTKRLDAAAELRTTNAAPERAAKLA